MTTALRPEPFADAIFRQLIASLPRTANERPAWHVAEPYLVRHAAQHAASAGLADELLQDPGFLVHADPETVTAALRQATTPDARIAAAVYRASQDVHRDLGADERRQILALDAARFQAADLSYDFARNTDWRPVWATGTEVSSALVTTFTDHTYRVRGVELSGVDAMATAVVDGRPVVVSASGDGVRVWDLATGRTTHTLSVRAAAVVTAVVDGRPVAVINGHGPVAMAVVDGRHVVITAGEFRTVQVWDLATGRATHTLTGDTGTVRVWEGDRQVAGPGTYDRTVRVWDLATNRAIHTITGHTGDVRAMATTVVDDRPVVVAGINYDGAVWVWDLATGRAVHTLTGDTSPVPNPVVATAVLDGRPVAVTGSGTNAVWVWDLATGRAVHTLTGDTSPVLVVATAVLDGRPVAVTSGRNRTIRVWDLATGRAIRTLTGLSGSVDAIATAAVDDRLVAITTGWDSVGGHDSRVRVWDLTTDAGIPTVTGHSYNVTAVLAAVVDGRPVAVTTGGDRAVRVRDLATGRTIHTLNPGGRVQAIATAMLDGRPVVITVSSDDRPFRRAIDESVRVWDLATGRATPLTGRTELAEAVATAVADGRTVSITTDGDRVVRVSDRATGRTTHPLNTLGRVAKVVATAVVDGRTVAIAPVTNALTHIRESTVRVSDLVTGRVIHTLTGHAGQVDAVAAVVVEGRPVAITGGGDSTVRVWDLVTGRVIHTLTGHAGQVDAVAAAVVEGRPIAITGSDDTTVRVWDLSSGSCLTVLTLPSAAKCAEIAADGTVVLGMGAEVIALTLEPVLRRLR
ncbi:hypothetical protein ACM01_01600 [Streptomyces viridochromogenes]|uniref:Uncharacterized protein n=1 Tax=Streptomyces viridochromogenes TaxID=1938 RepID=A0A0J7ZQA9_STRVR|nr:WD40 repeat domain-containing protein [Streptomyces viridochromogenes]KMS77343.1 hypothetical protein ACM01_01600 [Streptomyces viridochromogenes]KOG19066.1 hypothetical protein ADK36_20730 [Streptomyces viridochromogenes]KOG19305.1 hypothetical protein ADK35_20590 [Streptomyces viridochromogenes]